MEKQNMGDRIREVRKKRNLTQEQLAEKLGVTFTYVSELERNLKMPSMPLFIRLVEELDVSADYLLRDIVSPSTLYPDKAIANKMERLTQKQKIALSALIDTYITYL